MRTIDNLRRPYGDGREEAGAGEDIEFVYGSNRHRIAKIVKFKDDDGNTLPENNWKTTYYINDGSGRLASVTPWCHGLREGEVLRYTAEEIQKITTFSY